RGSRRDRAARSGRGREIRRGQQALADQRRVQDVICRSFPPRGIIAYGDRPPLRHASRATSPPFGGGEEKAGRSVRAPSSTPRSGGEVAAKRTEWGSGICDSPPGAGERKP